jgi:LuxR family transcriptional regulator, maltose regulon positive regulatory protein
VALLERVRLSCLEGRIAESAAYLDRLDRLVAKHPTPKSCARSDIRRYGILARAHVDLSQDRPQSAVSGLENLQREADDTRNYYFGLRVGTLLATAYLRAGARTDALAAFRRVLNAGQQVGLYQTILDQGPEIGDLLLSVRDETVGSGDSTDFVSYLDRLVERYGARYQPQVKSGATSASAEPLSAREGDILDLIAAGRSNKEIARILSIAPETVKTHVKHIFIKLNVEKRAQAVSRAQSLGLVGTP